MHRVFKMGGAHAIAALAYGTETVPRVDKIVGPGNVYVATAKRMVFGDVEIDTEAGPTEVMVIADRSANPAWVAADLISQAEHDEMAQAILITPAKGLVARVHDQIARQLKTLDRAARSRAKSLQSRGALITCKNMDECIALANRYAPEHLIVAAGRPGADREADRQRRRDLPRPLHAGGGRRLPGGPEPRAADRRHRALLLAALRGRLPEEDDRRRASSRRSCASSGST